jgi:hypothetical protein
MAFWKKSSPNEDVKRRVLRRLNNTTQEEVVRWLDNIHSGIGLNISEMRKSLSRNPEQALMYLDDIRTGAVSLLAAVQSLESRLNG